MNQREGVVNMREVPEETWEEGRFGRREQDLGSAGPRDAPRYPRHPIRALRSRVLKKLPKDGARVGG
jgi:hypothetical protein